MQLTPVLSLRRDYTDDDVLDIAYIYVSTSTSSDIAALRYSNIPQNEVIDYFRRLVDHNLANACRYPSIRDRPHQSNRKATTDIDHYETLIVRDLDLPPLGSASSGHGSDDKSSVPGRIVSYMALRYNSCSSSQPHNHKSQDRDHQGSDTPPSPAFPASGNADLQEHFLNQVDTALTHTFRMVKCYEVRQMSTLSPSHLRRGIARRMLSWALEQADHDHLPIVLAASQVGMLLYEAAGFVKVESSDPTWRGEDRWSGEKEGVVKIELGDWGGAGVYRHTLMLRWPERWEGTRDWWEYVRSLQRKTEVG